MRQEHVPLIGGPRNGALSRLAEAPAEYAPRRFSWKGLTQTFLVHKHTQRADATLAAMVIIERAIAEKLEAKKKMAFGPRIGTTTGSAPPPRVA